MVRVEFCWAALSGEIPRKAAAETALNIANVFIPYESNWAVGLRATPRFFQGEG
jgi:hypothetical protein